LPQAPAGTPNPALAHQSEDAGQRVFEQNCARCHNAPEGFPPSITGTIVRHMRVRASLSQEEEQELLHFFNP
jgi:mono/diheme cytochrome c family protein